MTNPTGKKYLENFTKDKPLPLSFSQWYNAMKTCSLKWHFNYNMKYRKHLPKVKIAQDGIDYHESSETGFNKIKVKDGQVDMFSSFIDKVPKEKREDLYFLEDWMQTKYDKIGKLPNIIGMELLIKAPPEIISGLWIQRIGVIDMLWRDDNGYFIWDFKTGDVIQKDQNSPNFGKIKTSKVNKNFHQQYFYRGILDNPGTKIYKKEGKKETELEFRGGKVAGVGLIFPKDKQFFRRLTSPVPRGTKNTSRLQDRSMKTLEKHLHNTLYKIMNEPIRPEFNAYYCNEWCDYAQEDTLLCNFESVDLSKLRPVSSLVELQLLADDLQDGDDWL